MPCFACIRSRSSTSRRAVPTPGPVRSGLPRGCRVAAGFGLWLVGSGGRVSQAGAGPGLAGRRGLVGPAGVYPGARIAVSDRGAGVPDAGGDAGDDAAGRHGIPGRWRWRNLYATRWRVEENLKSLKITMKMDVLKCTTVDGVHKELMMYAIAYNLVRLTMCEAGDRQGWRRIGSVSSMRCGGSGCRRGGGDAGVGGQPGASGTVRAAGEEAATEAVPGDEEAASRIAQGVAGEGLGGLIAIRLDVEIVPILIGWGGGWYAAIDNDLIMYDVGRCRRVV